MTEFNNRNENSLMHIFSIKICVSLLDTELNAIIASSDDEGSDRTTVTKFLWIQPLSLVPSGLKLA